MEKQSDAVNIEARRRLVLERYLDGATMRRIAEEFEISVGTVHGDIRFCREQWKEECSGMLESFKDRELERLDKIELAAWEGWERSLRDEIPPIDVGDEKPARVRQPRRFRDGDASFLKILTSCVDQRCKILGLHAPKQVELPAGGLPIKFIAGVDEEKI